MNKTNLRKSVKELRNKLNSLINKKVEAIIKSNAINVYNYPEDDALPKIIMGAVIKELQNEILEYKKYEMEILQTLNAVKQQ